MNLAPSLKRCLQAAAFNTVIAIGITVFGEHDLFSNLVYSQCIGLSIWALIEFVHDKLIDMNQLDTQWPRLLWLVPLCAALGYLVGTLLASTLLANHSHTYWIEQPRKALGYLLLSLGAGCAITYFFFSRIQLAKAREAVARTLAQAEAAQRQAAESQLKLLQSQLEPHMLFNTLANLRALIDHNPEQAQHMLDRIVAYLRATLNSSRVAQHPLQAEFDRLRDYLELMSVRMGPRLHYVLDLPAALADQPVPPLLLQPLVENAVKHGLEPKVDGGTITVRASRDDQQITLEVQDTGMGLPASQHASEGFGLAQVRERLATTYGTQGTIELIATSQGDTLARVTFPC